MARPDFTLKWAGSRLSIPAISAGNYAAGWDTYLGPLPPLGDDHDYVMNLQDSRAIWLGEQMLLAVGHEWQDDVSYDEYAIVRSPINGQLYRSLVGSNLGNEPSVSGSQWALGVVPSGTLPLGYFSGFTLANNGAAPNTTVDVAAGTARSSDNTADITLTGTLRGILQSSGAWAAGDNQNKLDAGAKAINSVYHAFAIRKTSDGAADILFSLSATAPTMPTGYAGLRRIGRIATDASGNIRQFKGRGHGRYDWVTPSLELTQVSVGGGTSLIALSGFGGPSCDVFMEAAISGDSAILRITAADQTDTTSILPISGWTGGVIANNDSSSVDGPNSFAFQVTTNASGQVRLRTSSASGGNLTTRAYVFGWREFL